MGKETLMNDLIESQKEAFYEEDVVSYSARINNPDVLNKYIKILEKPRRSKNGVAGIAIFKITESIMATELEAAGYIEFLENKWYHWVTGRITRYRLTEKGTGFLDSNGSNERND
jgi:hypothetical protein